MHIFLYSHWTALSLPTRQSIARVLNISKTGPTHVQDNRIVADGYPMEAVEAALNPENIKAVLGAKTNDPQELWDMLIASVTEPVVAEVAAPKAPEVAKPEQTLEESNAKPEKIKAVPAPVKEVKKVTKGKK